VDREASDRTCFPWISLYVDPQKVVLFLLLIMLIDASPPPPPITAKLDGLSID